MKTLKEKVLEILIEKNIQLTAKQIAIEIDLKYPEDSATKKKNMTGASRDIVAQLAAEIGARKNDLIVEGVQITTGKPRKYFLPSNSAIEEIKPQREHDLYPLVVKYLEDQLNIKAKRIDEKKSINSKGKGGNKWLFPDLVGIEDLSKNWCPIIKEFVKERDRLKTKLSSFEVKIQLTQSNVRESYYQALSNSSWANMGYLVASEILEEAMEELRILNSRHGIGIILLDVDSISDSQILIPARENEKIDLAMANRLCEENSDFKEYIKNIKNFYLTGDLSI